MYFLVKQSVQQEIILFICQDLIGSWKIGIYTVMLLASTSLSVRAREHYYIAEILHRKHF